MSKKSNFKKESMKLIKFILAGFVGIGIFIYLIFFGLSFPPCGEYENNLSIPNELIGEKVKFDSSIGYYAKIVTSNQDHCTKTPKNSDGSIRLGKAFTDRVKSGESTGRLLNIGDQFEIVDLVYIGCVGLSCYDGGSSGYTLVLKNEDGQQYLLQSFFFTEPGTKGQKHVLKFFDNENFTNDVTLEIFNLDK